MSYTCAYTEAQVFVGIEWVITQISAHYFSVIIIVVLSMQTQNFQLQFRQQDFKISFLMALVFLYFFFLRETWHNVAKYPQLFQKKEDFYSLL